MTTTDVTFSAVDSADKLRIASTALFDQVSIEYIYNPLEYAWKAHQEYLNRFATTSKKVLFLGMNPGPWGMAQTGVPFGEIDHVKNWMGVCEPVNKPIKEHPKRSIEGFNCNRSEVSGRRLWGLFKARFETADKFFKNHFVANYCPLVFMKDTGANLTPDKLSAGEQEMIYNVCNKHLLELIQILSPEWVIGVGGFAETRLQELVDAHGLLVKVGRILHPSPASPAANRDWAGTATKQLEALGIW